jgi:hypothetical protein
MIEISITEKTTKIIGIAMIIIGLALFFYCYNQGSIGQKHYSDFGCTVTEYETPTACAIANNQMTSGLIGMIFSFFTALFWASLVVPSSLVVLIKKMKR